MDILHAPQAEIARREAPAAFALHPHRTRAHGPTGPNAGADTRRHAGVAAAARILRARLEAGTFLDTDTLREAMTEAFGSDERAGAWQWRDAYDAAESAAVRLFAQHAATVAERGPNALLAMAEAIADREPRQRARTRESDRLQQHSTPWPIAIAAALAAQVRPGDDALEPSAGTGVLAALAHSALGGKGRLWINEIAPQRQALLADALPTATLSAHDAAQLSDRAPELRASVVLMNPPFSARIHEPDSRRRSDLTHIGQAYALLRDGGRLVAVTGSGCTPADPHFADVLARFGPRPEVLWHVTMDRALYARRGVAVATRLIVLERPWPGAAPGDDTPPPERLAESAAELLQAVLELDRDRGPVAPWSLQRRTRMRRTPDHHANRNHAKRRRSAAAPAPPPEGYWPDPVEMDYRAVERGRAPAPDPTTTSVFMPWRARTIHIPGAHDHPSDLVESSAMHSVRHRPPRYRPLLPARLISEGILSTAQLESVALAGEAHQEWIADGVTCFGEDGDWETDAAETLEQTTGRGQETPTPRAPARRGWMLGDGTGTGKGRQVAAIALDAWLRGTRRALWLSKSAHLIADARRDWAALGGAPEQIIAMRGMAPGTPIPAKEGILFATYATLRARARNTDQPSRLAQIVAWLAGGTTRESARHAFDGVVVFDESHELSNAAPKVSEFGEQQGSQQGIAAMRLQNALAGAKVLYVSATGASHIEGFAYASRLGLWAAEDMPFATREHFVREMERGGIAAMELVARDLKALGYYQSRSLSYAGVETELVVHELTAEQRAAYDTYAEAFQIIHENIEAALAATGIVDADTGETLDPRLRAAAIAAFEAMKQRFFAHVLCAMKIPTVIAHIERDLAEGLAPVIQLVSTGEALMERRLARIPASEWEDLSCDLTPKDAVIEYLERAFPTELYESYTDTAGNTLTRRVTDAEGRTVHSERAARARDALVRRIASLKGLPGALDQLIHRFGHDDVAEITGRSRRIVRIVDDDGTARYAVRPRSASASVTDAEDFMDGERRMLIFSLAGGTGRSYHASLDAKNQARRVHYLVEAGWQAYTAIQGLGRDHRTHQRSAPIFRPVTTDVRAERRFIATIARRIDSLGALTRGQRDAQGKMDESTALFDPDDNLESPYARAALEQLYLDLAADRIPGWTLARFEKITGLEVLKQSRGKVRTPDMRRTLNRMLALTIADQNTLFDALQSRIDALISDAKEAGVYDTGVETIRAEAIRIERRHPMYAHRRSGTETELVELTRTDRVTASRAEHTGYRNLHESEHLVINERSGRAAILTPHHPDFSKEGAPQPRVRLTRPLESVTFRLADYHETHWRATRAREAWARAWDEEVANAPATRDTRFWMVCGLLLPIWERLPKQQMQVRRLITNTGEELIGRIVSKTEAMSLAGNAQGEEAGPGPDPEAVWDMLGEGKAAVHVANGWRLRPRRVFGRTRLALEGPESHDHERIERIGVTVELIDYQMRCFVPDATVLARLLEAHPLQHIKRLAER